MRAKWVRIPVIVVMMAILLNIFGSSLTVVLAAPRVYLDPSSSVYTTENARVGFKFNVTVWVQNAASIGGVEIYLEFNDTMINVTRWFEPKNNPQYVFYGRSTNSLPPPPDPGYQHLGPGKARVMVAIFLFPTDPPYFTGTGKICIFEFRITAAPPRGGQLTSALHIDDAKTYLLDGDTGNEVLGIAKEDGAYTFIHVPALYALTITATAGGTTDPQPGTYSYPEGQTVSVQAMPYVGYGLDHWELDSANVGASSPLDVEMDSNHSLRAMFASLYNVTVKAYCDIESADVNVDIGMDGSPTGYTTPHTFTGLIRNHTFTVPSTDPSDHPFKKWNTGEASTTINITAGGTYTAYYAIKLNDVAVTDILPAKTVVGQEYSTSIDVIVENQGDYPEEFNVTVYVNATAIGTKTVALEIGASTTMTFSWNTSGFAKGNYTIKAYASPVEGEIDTTDNTLVDGSVFVTIPGDTNADRKVDLKDVYAVSKAYGSYPGHPKWNAICDINNDNKVDLKDYYITTKNYGKSW